MNTHKHLFNDDVIIMNAFYKELEKTAAFGLGAITPHLIKFIGKKLGTIVSPTARKSIAKSFQTAQTWGKATIDTSANSIAKAQKVFKNSNTSLRPMLGTKQAPITGVVNKPKMPSFSKDPMAWASSHLKGAIGDTARNLNHIGTKGIRDFVKTEVKNSQNFTKTVGNTTVQAKRSLAGKVLNPILGTGVGFGALDLATNSVDPVTGQKRTAGKRLGSALKESVMWGPLRKPTELKLLTYDLPKIGIDAATK